MQQLKERLEKDLLEVKLSLLFYFRLFQLGGCLMYDMVKSDYIGFLIFPNSRKLLKQLELKCWQVVIQQRGDSGLDTKFLLHRLEAHLCFEKELRLLVTQMAI